MSVASKQTDVKVLRLHWPRGQNCGLGLIAVGLGPSLETLWPLSFSFGLEIQCHLITES